jgi:plasmid stability protein
MATLTKRATVYFDPDIHRALRLKSAETTRSISDLVNDALRGSLAEDAEDLEAFEARAGDPLVSYEEMIKRLKADGRL